MTQPDTAAQSEIGGVMVPVTDRPLLASIPTWFWLGALVGISFAFRLVYALRDPGPWIFQDEMAYSELAKALGHTGEFAIREVPGTSGFGVVYPVLIAPAFALFDSVPSAYEALKVLNCLLMSLTAVPVYLMARRLVSRGLGLLAAALSVAIPSLMYTATVMTENAFYPLFATWALLLVLALERPTLWRQLALLALLLACFLTRVQAVTLVPALVTAVGLVALLDAWAGREETFVRRLGRRLTPFWPTGVLLGVAAVGVVGIQVARGKRIGNVLGSYAPVTGFEYRVSDIAHWLVYHVAEFELYVGLLPFGALILLAASVVLRRDEPRELRIFVAAAVSLVVWFLIVVSAFASTPTALRIEERNLFYVAPLFFVALVAWVARGLYRPWALAIPTAILLALLPLELPYNAFLNENATHSYPGLLPLMHFRDKYFSPGTVDEFVLAAAVAGALLFLLLPRRLGLVAPILILGYLIFIQRQVEGFTHKASVDSYRSGSESRPDWIDRRVGAGEDVSLLWAGAGGNYVAFWNAEFFNRSVGRLYSLDGPYDGLPRTRLIPDRRGVLRTVDGESLRARYVVASKFLFVRGRRLEEHGFTSLVLYLTRGPLRVDASVEGVYTDTWSTAAVRYVRFACRGGTLTVRLKNDPEIRKRPIRVVATVRGKVQARARVPTTAVRYDFSVPLEPVRGTCEVRFEVSPLASALIMGGGDARALGIRFIRFGFTPP